MLGAWIGMRLRWPVRPCDLEPITFALDAIMIAVREQPGCIRCGLSTNVGPGVVLEYVEEWKAEEDLRRELQSNRFVQLAELIERGLEAPVVEFSIPAGVRGLDYAEEVRGGPA